MGLLYASIMTSLLQAMNGSHLLRGFRSWSALVRLRARATATLPSYHDSFNLLSQEWITSLAYWDPPSNPHLMVSATLLHAGIRRMKALNINDIDRCHAMINV